MPRLFGVVGREDAERSDLFNSLSGSLSAGLGDRAEMKSWVEKGVAAGVMLDGQPFESGIAESEDGNYSAAYTGFFPSLRQLKKNNGTPPDAGTGELIIFLYQKEGVEFLKTLPGMFSIALHDRGEKLLLIAGDRSGAFPVYYFAGPDGLVFASSLKSVREATGQNALRTASVVEHLFFDALYGRYTFYQNLHIIEMGGYLSVNLDNFRVKRGKYFSYEELFDLEIYSKQRNIDAPAELTSHVRSCLQKITGGREQSDFGLSCGGGIDCSYIGGVLNDIGFSLPIFCTSIGDARIQEEGMACDTARRLGVELHTSYLETRDFYPFLLRAIVEFDQPIVHPTTSKFYAGSESELKQQRPHQIMGVASDLLFGGYGNVISFYKYLKLRRMFRIFPARFRRLMGLGVVDLTKLDLELRMRNPLKDIAGLGMGNLERASMQRRVRKALSGIENDHERMVKILMLENLFDYQQHLLNRRYEASARCGTSLYYPFLDLEMLEFAVNLPVSHCVNWRTAKSVVRKAALPYLGEGLAARAKYGGDVPLRKWIWPMRFLLEDGLVSRVLSYSHQQLGEIVEGNLKLLWNMIDLELWGRLCLEGQTPEELLEEFRSRGIDCSPFRR